MKEKVELFDKIATQFYEANFGQLSKADMELMMFQIYYEKLVKQSRFEDGTIDYCKCSDYKISHELGITQQRVRNLKVRNQLRNPIEYKWQAALARLTDNARYDRRSGKVIINIPDPNLFLEIQNFIEEQGAFVEKQLNSKILQIRAEYYIALIISMEPEKSRKEIVKLLKKQFKISGKDEEAFDEKNIGKSLIDLAVDISTIASEMAKVLSPQNLVGNALLNLLRSING